MGRRTWNAVAAGVWLSGCAASLPPEAQPKPYSLNYARQTLVGLKPTWILANATTVRNARVGKFQGMLAGQSSVCVAYDIKDRSGADTGLKTYIVFISPDHASVTQVIPPNSSYPCTPEELEPYPELNGTNVAAAPAKGPPLLKKGPRSSNPRAGRP